MRPVLLHKLLCYCFLLHECSLLFYHTSARTLFRLHSHHHWILIVFLLSQNSCAWKARVKAASNNPFICFQVRRMTDLWGTNTRVPTINQIASFCCLFFTSHYAKASCRFNILHDKLFTFFFFKHHTIRLLLLPWMQAGATTGWNAFAINRAASEKQLAEHSFSKSFVYSAADHSKPPVRLKLLPEKKRGNMVLEKYFHLYLYTAHLKGSYCRRGIKENNYAL